jgi:hypothetical protein
MLGSSRLFALFARAQTVPTPCSVSSSRAEAEINAIMALFDGYSRLDRCPKVHSSFKARSYPYI